MQEDENAPELMARNLFVLGRLEEALGYLKKTFQNNQETADSYFLLGQIYAGKSDFKAAEIAYRTCLEKNKGHGRARRAMEMLSFIKTNDSKH
jgi:tetratricopeptide (TPR) repeat protein